MSDVPEKPKKPQRAYRVAFHESYQLSLNYNGIIISQIDSYDRTIDRVWYGMVENCVENG